MSTEKRTANIEIKQKNRTSIFQLLRRRSGISRQDIVSALDLSLPTVTQNLIELEEEGLICPSGSIGNTGGRRARAYSMVRDARTAIGLEITKHHLSAVAVDLSGSLIATIRERVNFSQTDDYYRKLGEIITRIVELAHLKEENILGVGIGVPGLITADNREVFYGEILHFTGATCEEFSKYIPYPTALFNDANAAGFAETWSNPGTRNAFYIMLSTNVGGAVYINDRQYSGDNIRAGEVGHMVIVPGGKQCYCGRQGCLDAYCAATVLSSVTDGNLSRFFEGLQAGDPEIRAHWERYLQHLATAVMNVRMLFDCDIIIGGYVGSYMDVYLDDLKKFIEGQSSFEKTADYLVPCRYKTEAIAAGAALYYISVFLNSI